MPSAVPPSFGDAALIVTGGSFALPRRPIGAALYRWRSAPEPTDVRGSRRLVFGPEAPGAIPCRRRSGSHQPPDLWIDVRRVLVPFTARCFVMSAEYGRRPNEASSACHLIVGSTDGRIGSLVPNAAHHGECRITRKRSVGDGPLAQPKRRATLRLGEPRVATRSTQPRVEAGSCGRRGRIGHAARVARHGRRGCPLRQPWCTASRAGSRPRRRAGARRPRSRSRPRTRQRGVFRAASPPRPRAGGAPRARRAPCGMAA